MQETPVQFLGQEVHWRRDKLPIPVFLGFPCGSAGKESTHNAGIWVRSLGWEDPLEKGKTIFWPGEFHELHSPWGLKESDMTERLSLSQL